MRRTDPETREKGAHFLTSKPALERVVAAAALKPGESVLDVGAGGGSITRRLAAAVAPGGSVLAIEKEPELVEALRQMDWPGTTVAQGDALRVALPGLIDAVVANPPYRILPALLRRLLAHGFGRAVLVMPEELATRLTAAPGSDEYGKLTVQVALRGKAKVLFPLKRSDFDPPPRVASVVVQVTPKAAPGLDWGLLDRLLDAAWAAKRLTLGQSLAAPEAGLRVPVPVLQAALGQSGARDRRPRDVAPWEFAQLAITMGLGLQEHEAAEKARKRRRKEALRADAPAGPAGPA
ncbi:MAG TPA: rRNA adenine dimethyltransferase family protein [Candidatus Thermoplasmatota archaeon]|nr:rRNA adenine dimethyltransferase family protein [Candidatus Thermoplasmatota archaeon]